MSFNVFIGYDDREPEAYDVCKYSIERRTKSDVKVFELNHRSLRKQGIFRRPWITTADEGIRIDLIDGKPFSTEFSHTRFLVPYLNNYKGWALFMDCDMIFTQDIRNLIDMASDQYAVMVVKHRHKPTNKVKMDDQPQHSYGKKNWSSFILWNCGHPANKYLTPEKVNFMTGRDLHQFDWLEENQIGHLGFEYNWIEGSSPAVSKPAVIHYTNGGPWFNHEKYPECHSVMYADLWEAERNHMIKYGE